VGPQYAVAISGIYQKYWGKTSEGRRAKGKGAPQLHDDFISDLGGGGVVGGFCNEWGRPGKGGAAPQKGTA